MKKSILLAGLFLIGCAQTETLVLRGEKGEPGTDGFSMVASSTSTDDMCGLGRAGTQVTLALDLDRSQSFSNGDLVQTQYITCDGAAGMAGLGCSVQKNGSKTTVTCGEQSVVVNDGVDGQNGKSAYEVWLEKGNEGTEADFLMSLVGPKGAAGTNGTNGLSAYQIWLSLGNTGTEAQFIASLTGPMGLPGLSIKGDKGDKGDAGVTPSGIFISAIQNPCGVESDGFDEVILKLSNGKFLGVYDGGANLDHLHVMVPGATYVTTDRTGDKECKLIVEGGVLKSCLQKKNPSQQCVPAAINTVNM